MFDHITFPVSDYPRSRRFFEYVLRPLEIHLLVESDGWAGFGRERPQMWFGPGLVPAAAFHIAFTATTRAQVRAFHEAALTQGAIDNGPPRPSSQLSRELLRCVRARTGRAQLGSCLSHTLSACDLGAGVVRNFTDSSGLSTWSAATVALSRCLPRCEIADQPQVRRMLLQSAHWWTRPCSCWTDLPNLR